MDLAELMEEIVKMEEQGIAPWLGGRMGEEKGTMGKGGIERMSVFSILRVINI